MNNKAANRPGKSSIGLAALMGLIPAFALAPFLAAEEPKKPGQTFPKQVLIIRHAEKPPDEDKSVHLSEQGEKRAKALHELFEGSRKRPDPLPRPDFIFATHNSHNSHRPVETVTPLSKALKLPINDTFRDEEILDLSKEILGNKKYQGKTVLVCWHHGTMPALAKLLHATGHPVKVHGEVFDRVWQITYDDKGHTTFTDRPQRLLPGDSKKQVSRPRVRP